MSALQPQLKLLYAAGAVGTASIVLALLTTFVWYSSPTLPTPSDLFGNDLPTAPSIIPPSGMPTLPTDFPDYPTNLPTDFPDLPSLPPLPGGAG